MTLIKRNCRPWGTLELVKDVSLGFVTTHAKNHFGQVAGVVGDLVVSGNTRIELWECLLGLLVWVLCGVVSPWRGKGPWNSERFQMCKTCGWGKPDCLKDPKSELNHCIADGAFHWLMGNGYAGESFQTLTTVPESAPEGWTAWLEINQVM